jgi:hypothetical protein
LTATIFIAEILLKVALNTIPPPPNLRKEERNQDKVKESMFLKILVEGLLFHFLPKWKQIILRCHFQQYFSYKYRGSQFIGGGNRNTRRKPPTCRKSPTNFIT